MVGMHCGVEEDGVGATVPAHVDEADQGLAIEGADPGQAVPCQAQLPWTDHRGSSAKRERMQMGQRLVVDRKADAQVKSHDR